MKGLKALIFTATLITLIVGAGAGAYAANIDPLNYSAHSSIGFKYMNGGIKYIQPNGTLLTNAWVQVGNQKWCFDGNGNMLMGFYVVDNHMWGLTYDGVATLMDPAIPVAPVYTVGPAAPPIPYVVPAQPPLAATAPVPAPAKKSGKKAAPKPVPAPKKAPDGKSAEDDENWGISQPELGF